MAGAGEAAIFSANSTLSHQNPSESISGAFPCCPVAVINALKKHQVDNLEKLAAITPGKLRHSGHLHKKLSTGVLTQNLLSLGGES